ELTFWEQILLSGGAARAVTGIYHSPEARTRLVNQWFVASLGRDASAAEQQAFVGALVGGLSQEQAYGALLATDEYYLHAAAGGPATDTAYIQSLFHQLLHRDPSATELNNFLTTVLPAHGRPGAAASILGSPEYRGNVIRDAYTHLLLRTQP